MLQSTHNGESTEISWILNSLLRETIRAFHLVRLWTKLCFGFPSSHWRVIDEIAAQEGKAGAP